MTTTHLLIVYAFGFVGMFSALLSVATAMQPEKSTAMFVVVFFGALAWPCVFLAGVFTIVAHEEVKRVTGKE